MPDTAVTQPLTALVTGATSGLGKEIAVRLARDDMRVIVVERDAARGAAVAGQNNPRQAAQSQSDKESTMATSLLAISVDGSDVARLAQFWADVLDRPVSPGATGSFAAIDTASGLRLMFHQVPEGKTVKNRLHPDLATSDYERETSRLTKLGAVKLNELEQGGTRWTTFADPEGNEFDLIATTP